MLPDKSENDAKTEIERRSIDEPQDDDTLIVAPPGFRERLLAAQKARTSEIRQSVEIPNPLLHKPDDTSPPQEQQDPKPGNGKPDDASPPQEQQKPKPGETRPAIPPPE